MMIYKNRKDYEHALKNLETALYEGAYRAKRKEEADYNSDDDEAVQHTQSG